MVKTVQSRKRGQGADFWVGYLGIKRTIEFLHKYLGEDKYTYLKEVFDRLGEDEYQYGTEVKLSRIPSLESLVKSLPLTGDFFVDEAIKQIKDSEQYYRIKALDEDAGWNVRDQHMARLITTIISRFQQKMICWLHNTHTGDMFYVKEFHDNKKYSAMTVLRKLYHDKVYSIGLVSYDGTVTASDHWYGKVRQFKLNPSIKDSVGDLFHNSLGKNFMLILRGNTNQNLLNLMHKYWYQRFIGGVYDPDNEIEGHYVHGQLYPEFDALIYFDRTTAL